jgi:uncharacterized damage-inducible protein DinB
MRHSVRAIPLAACLALSVAAQQTPKAPPTPAQSLQANWTQVHGKVLTMAEDFPEEKYDFKPAPEERSFAEQVLHVMAGEVYATKAGRGEKAEWVDRPRSEFKSKAEIVAAFKKALDESSAVLKGRTTEQLARTLSPWPGLIEHAGEHYGQLVVYYRVSGLVPPESREKPKS